MSEDVVASEALRSIAVIESLKVSFENELFVDVTIYCNDGSLNCHRAILGAVSPVLRDLLVNRKDENISFSLPDYDYEIVYDLLQLLYYGKVALDKQNHKKLSDLCEFLKIDAVKHCELHVNDDEDSTLDEKKNFKIKFGKSKFIRLSSTKEAEKTEEGKSSKTFSKNLRIKPLSSNIIRAANIKKQINVKNRCIIPSDLKCKKCDITFSSRISYRKHWAIHQQLYKCQYCRKCFGESSKLKIHITRVHKKNLETCTSASFPKKKNEEPSVNVNSDCSSLKILKMKGRAVYKCTFCQTTADNSTSMHGHLNKEHSYQHECIQCGKTFSSKSNLQRHIFVIHKKHTQKSANEMKLRKEKDDISFAESDELKINTPTKLKNVLLKMYPSGSAFNITVPDDLKCSLCDHVSTNRKTFRFHHIKHLRVYNCVICNKAFGEKRKLILHILHIHSKKEWYRFLQKDSLLNCEKQLSPKSGEINSDSTLSKNSTDDDQENPRSKHYIVVHTGHTRLYMCKYCNKKVCQTSSGIMKHAKKMHLKLNCCALCGSCYETPTLLIKHEKKMHSHNNSISLLPKGELNKESEEVNEPHENKLDDCSFQMIIPKTEPVEFEEYENYVPTSDQPMTILPEFYK